MNNLYPLKEKLLSVYYLHLIHRYVYQMYPLNFFTKEIYKTIPQVLIMLSILNINNGQKEMPEAL